MELIKKIKKAEAEAKEIVENARKEAGRIAEESAADKKSSLQEAENSRRKAIDSAVAEAEEEGKAEAEELKKQEADKRQALIDNAKQNMDAAVGKIVEEIKS